MKVKKVRKLILYISVAFISLLLVLFLSFYFFIKRSFRLNGDKEITINVFEKYEDKGYSIKIFNHKYVKIDNNVDVNKIGSYTVKYTLKHGLIKFSIIRIVNVVDNIDPEIELVSDDTVYICNLDSYKEPGYKAFDNYDNDITDKVVVTRKEDNSILYEVKDSSGNSAFVSRNVVVKDKENPRLSLKGDSVIYIKVGSLYEEAGYTVSDNCTQNVKVTSKNNVDTSKVGTYYYAYTANDNAGNTSKVSRKIVVYEPDLREGKVYLTFDDGPSNSGTTSKILDVLKKENVKATFFVTGTGSDDLIKREYDEGHTILLHTYSHQWKLYSSVDSYFEDLNKIASRVYKITGKDPKIIRFPGGSNNTVSNNYNYGIMDTLTTEVLNRGYDYVDWNVSAQDAGGCSTSKCVYNSVINGLSKDRDNIVLMHDIKLTTAGAIEDIIHYLKENNYKFYTISSAARLVKFK